MRGQVYKAHTDSYSVKCGEKLYKCGARGVLKLKRNDITVGDFVDVEKGVICSVEKRQNRFIRPSVSNVDLIVAVISPQPKPDYYLLDKLLINAVKEGVELAIAVNKTDIDNEVLEEIQNDYAPLGIDIICVSAKTGEGIDRLKKKLEGKLTVLSGQSAVGKTSIINSMFSLDLKVGDLSDKILRGKHTTTRSEIFEFENVRIIDSPGFAVIDAFVTLDELPDCYNEYFTVSGDCKFRGCSHINEPECRVKELVEKGVLSTKRYERYKEIYDEISKRRNIYEKD